MNENQINLLTKDLNARLPYHIKGVVSAREILTDSNGRCFYTEKEIDTIVELIGIYADGEILVDDGKDYDWDFIPDGRTYTFKDFKPYLRPMSSMTNEEKEELRDIFNKNIGFNDVGFNDWGLEIVNKFDIFFSYLEICDITDWLNIHHFDYRGLIKEGLALVAPDGMYN